MAIEFEPIPYRIRIGITGHRRLDDPAAVQEVARRAIDAEIPHLYSKTSCQTIERVRAAGTTPISYLVLTALAEGADRFVARALLEAPGARLCAVLPLSVDDYLDDFATQASKREFCELFALSRNPVQLRTRRIAEGGQSPDGQAELRHKSYKAAGEYLVDHSDVIIAVWDGEPARGKGGTAETVEYALKQGRPVIRLWRGEHSLLNADTCNGLDTSALEGIDRFNRYPISDSAREDYVRNMDHDLFAEPQTASSIAAETRAIVNRFLLPYYAQTSIVTKANRDAFHRAGRGIYLLSAAAVACAAVGVLFRSLAAVGYSAELILLLAIIFMLSQARRRHAHQAWIEYRFLAERIRSGIFMAICGIEPMPIEVLPYMGHSQTVNDWSVRVFDEIWAQLPVLKDLNPGDFAGLKEYVREVWIENQIEFHRNKAHREGQWRHRLAKAGAIVLPVTVAAAAAHLILLGWEPPATAESSLRTVHLVLHQALAFVALLFPAIAASLAGMEAHREHLRLEKRSENMAPQLERLRRQLESTDDPVRFVTLLHQADELMLRETQDWLMLMRYVEIKAG